MEAKVLFFSRLSSLSSPDSNEDIDPSDDDTASLLYLSRKRCRTTPPTPYNLTTPYKDKTKTALPLIKRACAVPEHVKVRSEEVVVVKDTPPAYRPPPPATPADGPYVVHVPVSAAPPPLIESTPLLAPLVLHEGDVSAADYMPHQRPKRKGRGNARKMTAPVGVQTVHVSRQVFKGKTLCEWVTHLPVQYCGGCNC